MKPINVAIIGCGAIGITSALAIQDKLNDVNVTIFARDFTPNTTSDVAAGLWEPYLVGDTPADKIFQWSKDTFDYLLQLWKEGKARDAGITLQFATCVTDRENFSLPDWLELSLGYSALSKDRVDIIGKRIGQNLTGGFQFTTFVWEASIFIPFLTKKFIANGGQILRKTIQNFTELTGYDVIVNCTGLAAQDLADDKRMKPIRGQIMRVKAPWQKGILVTDSKFTCYVIPNTDCVIMGGTKQENYNLDVDEVDRRDILRKCSNLIPSMRSAEIIMHQVGLRPSRDKVRLEVEIRKYGENEACIVHNYGHGGSGITLAVGCAREAADLVSAVLKKSKSKL